MNTNKYDTVIWDFNGTILDDLSMCLKIINSILKEHQLPLLTKKTYLEVFRFPIESYYDDIGLTACAPFSELAKIFSEQYVNSVAKMACFSDIAPTVKALTKLGIKQVVISASNHELLIQQMKDLKIAEYFEEILGISDIYAAGKTEIAVNWRKINKLDRVLWVGDTDHDYEIAKLIRADCVLIARGHVSAERLHKTKALVLDDAQSIVAFCG